MLHWLIWRHWPWLPAAIQQWQRQLGDQLICQLLAPGVAAAQADRVGITEVWASPDTPATEILEWIAETIAAAPRPLARTTDQFKVALAHCTEAEFTAVEAGADLHLDADRVRAQWRGPRTAWFWHGYDMVASSIPEQHGGLYVAVNAVGTAIDAAITHAGSDHGRW